jgi:hypothetical protein
MSVMATFLVDVSWVAGTAILRACSLDDNVVGTADDTETLALDDTGRTGAQQGLVGGNGDTERTGIVAGIELVVINMHGFERFLLAHGDGRSRRLVVVAPVVLVDSNLASRTSTPRSATGTASSTLSATEVKSLGEDNDTRGRVTKVRDQLGSGAGVDGSSRATTSNTLGETLRSAGDGDSSSLGSESCEDGSELHIEVWHCRIELEGMKKKVTGLSGMDLI